MQRKHVCIVSTVPFVLKWFMTPHINSLSKEYDVTIVTSGSAEDLDGLLSPHVTFVPLNIERKISIINDAIALFKLWALFRKERFDSVHSIMPKSGLLAMLAARLAGVPLRFHTFTGQVWANKHGLGRLLLKFLDKILVINSTCVLADSHSQRKFLLENNVVAPSSILVLAEGSVAGVNINRFKFSAAARVDIRAQLKLPREGVVFLYLGRLNKDKGLKDLLRAFSSAADQKENLHLLVVGPDEDKFDFEFSTLARRFPGRVHRVGGVTECPENYMSAADVFCLPSYREGFGTVIIEAGAIGLPAIASRIYGITDAVVDGTTGILHQPTSDNEIAEAMLLLATNESLRRRMGEAARVRVRNDFSEEYVAKAFTDFYREMFSLSILNDNE
ncbi:glycosyltransferase family 4 protein [Pseudomonadota bacterium]